MEIPESMLLGCESMKLDLYPDADSAKLCIGNAGSVDRPELAKLLEPITLDVRPIPKPS